MKCALCTYWWKACSGRREYPRGPVPAEKHVSASLQPLGGGADGSGAARTHLVEEGARRDLLDAAYELKDLVLECFEWVLAQDRRYKTPHFGRLAEPGPELLGQIGQLRG